MPARVSHAYIFQGGDHIASDIDTMRIDVGLGENFPDANFAHDVSIIKEAHKLGSNAVVRALIIIIYSAIDRYKTPSVIKHYVDLVIRDIQDARGMFAEILMNFSGNDDLSLIKKLLLYDISYSHYYTTHLYAVLPTDDLKIMKGPLTTFLASLTKYNWASSRVLTTHLHFLSRDI